MRSLEPGDTVTVSELVGTYTVLSRYGYSDRAQYVLTPKSTSAIELCEALGCARVYAWAERVSPYFTDTQETLL